MKFLWINALYQLSKTKLLVLYPTFFHIKYKTLINKDIKIA